MPAMQQQQQQQQQQQRRVNTCVGMLGMMMGSTDDTGYHATAGFKGVHAYERMPFSTGLQMPWQLW
jgi:hypothetical protein